MTTLLLALLIACSGPTDLPKPSPPPDWPMGDETAAPPAADKSTDAAPADAATPEDGEAKNEGDGTEPTPAPEDGAPAEGAATDEAPATQAPAEEAPGTEAPPTE